MTFREMLRDARKTKGMTQEGVARALDVTLKTVQSWESGRSEPRYSQLIRVCDLFDWTRPSSNGHTLDKPGRQKRAA